MTDAVAQRLALVAREKDITLNVDAPSMPEIAGDGDRLVQVVTNLIGNAIKYTPRGGQVWISTRVEKTGVMLTVRDNGQGIPASIWRAYSSGSIRWTRREDHSAGRV